MYLLIQPLHGITFGLFWSAVVDYAFVSAPNDLKATSQGVVSTSYYIVGSGFGAVLWSGVFESLGARYAYVLGAILVSVTGFLLLGGGHGCGKVLDTYSQPAPRDRIESWTPSKMEASLRRNASRNASEDEPLSPTLEGGYLLGALSDEQEREKIEQEQDQLLMRGSLRDPVGGGVPPPTNGRGSPKHTVIPKGAATTSSSNAQGRLNQRAARTPAKMPYGVAVV